MTYQFLRVAAGFLCFAGVYVAKPGSSYCQSPKSAISTAAASAVATGDGEDVFEQITVARGEIAAGTYDIYETIDIDLTAMGAIVIRGSGPVTLRMRGPGPAIRLRGSLTGSASPKQIDEPTWLERMPVIEGLSVIGAHPESDGIELIGTMQATIRAVQIRKARHGIILRERNRNLNISDVHLYDNSGIGLWLDDVNLHQINISNSHISYNRGGGIVARGGNVRNIQITGCDIEANMTDDQTPTDSANVLIDSSTVGSIAEVAITGNTIQHSAHYGAGNLAPGGANIRMLGRDDYSPNMITITGNILSDTETHVHLHQASDVTVVGNTFFTTEPTDMRIEQCSGISIGSNVLNPRESTDTGQILISDSSECLITGLICRNLRAGEAAITLRNCRNSLVHHCLISGSKSGIIFEQCTDCYARDCLIASESKGSAVMLQTGSSEDSSQPPPGDE